MLSAYNSKLVTFVDGWGLAHSRLSYSEVAMIVSITVFIIMSDKNTVKLFKMTSSDEYGNEDTNPQWAYIWLLTEELVVLNIPQAPEVNGETFFTISRFIKVSETHFGTQNYTRLDDEKIISNMETELKKSDVREIGNKKIVLKKFEEEMQELVDSCRGNPKI